jgi:hypothetical protein
VTLAVQDLLNGTSGTDLSAHTTDVGAFTWSNISSQSGTCIFTTNGTVRQGAALAVNAIYALTTYTPPTSYRVVAKVSLGSTFLAGLQSHIDGKLPSAPSPTAQDRYSCAVNALDGTGNNNVLRTNAYSASGTSTVLVDWQIPSWALSTDKYIGIGFSIPGAVVTYFSGMPVTISFDTSVVRSGSGRAGVGQGPTQQSGAGIGFQLNEYYVDDLSDAPTNTGTGPTITGAANVGQQLTAHPTTWSAGDTTTWVWLRSSATGTGTGYVAIPGASGPTYTLTSQDLNQRIRAIEMRSTGAPGVLLQGCSVAVTAATAVVGDVIPAPTNSIPPHITGPALTGNIASSNNPLFGDDGTWTNASSFVEQWEVSPTGLDGSWSDIGGATGLEFTPDDTFSGSYIRLRVDGLGPGGGPLSAYSITIQVVTGEAPPPSEDVVIFFQIPFAVADGNAHVQVIEAHTDVVVVSRTNSTAILTEFVPNSGIWRVRMQRPGPGKYGVVFDDGTIAEGHTTVAQFNI